MKKLIVAALAVIGLGGCVVADPYYGTYYPAPAVGVGVYSAPVYRHHHHHRHHGHRHHGHHRHHH